MPINFSIRHIAAATSLYGNEANPIPSFAAIFSAVDLN